MILDEILNQNTHKNQGLSIGERVAYTLDDLRKSGVDASPRLLALLLQQLFDQSVLSERDVDDLLLRLFGHHIE